MPIKDLTDNVRLPRLGKIHLGYKHPEKGYPVKTDYFVLPADHSDYHALVKLFGEKPKELRILIPVEDEELWASQYYKAYSRTFGLVCKGDGENATRMIDKKTGAAPEKETATAELREVPCAGRDCPDYKAKKCQEIMNLRFMLPEVPGLGVWQIDTGSINSILNINSGAKLIKKAFGRISLIPLKLTFEPAQVNNPETGKKQTVYVMNLRTTVTMAQLADVAREQAKTFMLEAPDLEAVFDEQVQRDIDELWPEGKPVEPTAESKPAQEVKPEPTKQATPTASIKTGTADEDFDKLKGAERSASSTSKRDPLSIKTGSDLFKACKEDWKLTPAQVLKELNVDSTVELADLADAYRKIAEVR